MLNYRSLDHPTGAKLMDLEDQLKICRRQLEKKDEVIRTLTLLRAADGSTSGVTSNPGRSKVTFDPPRTEAPLSRDLLSDHRMTVDAVRSEYAALLVKYEGSEAEVRDLQERLTAREASLLQLRGELEDYKEHDARQASLIRSLKDRMRESQEFSGTTASEKTLANCSIRSLQDENQDLKERISELEERLRLHLRVREQSDQRAASAERRLTAGIEKLARGLSMDPEGQRDPLDFLTSKASELFQEHLLWERKIATLEEALVNQELEFKAGRQTLMKLVLETGKAQQTAASFSEEMKAVGEERDEALLLKRTVEQDNKILRDRLEDSQRALGTACHKQVLHEKQVSDLDDSLRTSTYETRAANALHQSFIDQLATLLSNGFISVPASEEAIKSKVREICGNDRNRISNVNELEEQITELNEQLEHQSKLYHETLGRARRAEERLNDREEALRHLEGQLAAKDLLKDGREFERHKHMKFLQQLAERLKVEQGTSAGDSETRNVAMLARAQQLAELEAEGLSKNKELLHTLQRKVTAQREKLASSKRRIEQLSSKLDQLEARTPDRVTLTVGHEEKEQELSKLRRKMERLQEQLSETKISNQSLRTKCMEITDLKAKTKEQNRTIEKLSESLEKLETIKEKAARKVVTLKSELDHAEHGAWERSERAQNELEALGNELRTTKRALEEVARRESQLVDFREFVTRALGFEANTMVVPDDRIYLQLKGLLRAQPCRGLTVLDSESWPRRTTEGLGARYLGSRPSGSPPPDWDQRRSQHTPPLRSYSRTSR